MSGFNHTTDNVKTYGSEVLLLQGSFDNNGTSNPASPLGGWFTVTRTGVGAFLITPNDVLPTPYNMDAHQQMNAPDNSTAQCGAWTASSGGSLPTLALKTFNSSSAATDMAANANNRVHFTLAFKLYSESRP
jgi:hypothetical protein